MHEVSQPATGENGPNLKQQAGANPDVVTSAANSHRKSTNGFVTNGIDNDGRGRIDSGYLDENDESSQMTSGSTNGALPLEEDLPQEMTGMIPLKSIVEKLVYKSYGELQSLMDTLPSLGDMERKYQILEYVTSTRQQFVKLLVLVKFASDARNVQKCQDIMAFLVNQNQYITSTVDSLWLVHSNLAQARVRNYDIPTAVDVLTTGTYQRMPARVKNIVPPSPLSDEEVLETFARLDDVIRMRMLTGEVVPPPMRKYRIEDGRTYFHVENEFEVALTLVGPSNELRWHIVSLEVLVKSSGEGGFDIDTSLNEQQITHLIKTAMQQMTPLLPTTQTTQLAAASAANTPSSAAGFAPATPLHIGGGTPAIVDPNQMPAHLPLVKLYDYLHMFCLNMQLEVLYLQAMMLVRTRWADQLRVEMSVTRTTLRLAYWLKGDVAATWSSSSSAAGAVGAQASTAPTQGSTLAASTRRIAGTATAVMATPPITGVSSNSGRGAVEMTNFIEIAIVEDEDKAARMVTVEDVRGGGSMMDGRVLGYSKSWIEVRWTGGGGEKNKLQLKINPANLNVERLLMQVVRASAKAMIHKFRDTLYETITDRDAVFRVREEDVIVVGGETKKDTKDASAGGESSSTGDVGKGKSSVAASSGTTMLVRYRENRFVSISVDVRTGRVVVSEVGTRAEDGDAKLKFVENHLNIDPGNIANHLLYLRGETVIDEIASMAKQLGLEVYDKITLKPEDMNSIFGSVTKALPPVPAHGFIAGQTAGAGTQLADVGPKHKTFLQFSQYQDYYLIIAVVDNKFRFWLAGVSRPEQSSAVYTLASAVQMNFEALWRDHFKIAPRTKRGSSEHVVAPIPGTIAGSSRKRKLGDMENSEDIGETVDSFQEPDRPQVDGLRMDLRFLAKLDSFCRANITYSKLDQKLRDKKITFTMRRAPGTLAVGRGRGGGAEEQHNASMDSVPVIWIKQKDLPLPDSSVMADAEDFVILRVDGWWACGRSDCYVVAEQKLEAKHVPPISSSAELNHIRFDKATMLLSFTYPNINTCVQQFVEDRERVVMMSELARQLKSEDWLSGNEFVIDSFDWQALRFVYAKRFSLSIRWRAESVDIHKRTGRYVLELGEVDPSSLSTDVSSGAQPNPRNPHWRVATFLEDTLNRNRKLTHMIEMMHKTLSLLLLLDEMESAYKQAGAFDRITIIPRSADFIRIVYSSLVGLDIEFTMRGMVITDASKAAVISTSNAPKSTPARFNLPAPYLIPTRKQAGTAESTDLTPIHIAKKLELKEFTLFHELVRKMDEWILAENENESVKDEIKMVVDETEDEQDEQQDATQENEAFDVVLPIQYGLICSISFCGTVLRKIDKEMRKVVRG